MRCQACNKMLSRQPRYIYLEDGEKIEDSVCPACRHLAFSTFDVLEKTYQFADLTDFQDLFNPSGLTSSKESVY